MQALGASGWRALRSSDLRYDKIIIMTDAGRRRRTYRLAP